VIRYCGEPGLKRDHSQDEVKMSQLTPEEEKAIAESPKGTWAILLIYAAFMVAGWCYMFFGYFLPHGAVQ